MNDSRVSILVVEDDSDALRELSKTLSPVRFRVATGSFGPAILEFVEECAPDFVVFDARHLYLQGVALSQKVRERSARTRVLFLDVEDNWSLLLQPLGSDGSETRITPCMRREVLHTVATIAESGEVPTLAESLPLMDAEGADWRSCVE